MHVMSVFKTMMYEQNHFLKRDGNYLDQNQTKCSDHCSRYSIQMYVHGQSNSLKQVHVHFICFI